MTRTITILAVLSAMLVLAAVGCSKLNIPGNVAGQLLNASGQPQGYTSVKLCAVDSGEEVAVQTSEDSGNFFFDKIPPGEYQVKVAGAGGNDMPCDSKPFKLGPGKTMSLTITILAPEEQAGGEE